MSIRPDPHEQSRLLDILARHREELAARPGVEHLDVGFRLKNGQLTDELAIRVHVRRKLPAQLLPASEMLPGELEGVPLDVIESGRE